MLHSCMSYGLQFEILIDTVVIGGLSLQFHLFSPSFRGVREDVKC